SMTHDHFLPADRCSRLRLNIVARSGPFPGEDGARVSGTPYETRGSLRALFRESEPLDIPPRMPFHRRAFVLLPCETLRPPSRYRLFFHKPIRPRRLCSRQNSRHSKRTTPSRFGTL